MKLSGTMIVEVTCPALVPARSRDRLGQVGRRVLDRGRRAVLALVAQHGQARVLVGIELVAERVLDARAELDRVGSAQLLEREADLELGRGLGRVVFIERRDREYAA